MKNKLSYFLITIALPILIACQESDSTKQRGEADSSSEGTKIVLLPENKYKNPVAEYVKSAVVPNQVIPNEVSGIEDPQLKAIYEHAHRLLKPNVGYSFIGPTLQTLDLIKVAERNPIKGVLEEVKSFVAETGLNMFNVGSNYCQDFPQPSLDFLTKRKELLRKDKVFLAAICAPGGPSVHLCETLMSYALLDDGVMKAKMLADSDFWKKVVELDLMHSIYDSKSVKNPRYYHFYHLLLRSLLDKIDGNVGAGHKVDLLFAGDSLFSLMEMGLQENAFKNSAIFGLPTDRITAFLPRLVYAVKAYKPKSVVLSISGNDHLYGCDENEIRDHRLAVVKALKDLGVTTIYWFAIPPVDFQYPLFKESVPKENIKIASIPGIQFLDTYTLQVGLNGRIRNEYHLDGIHFNALGFEKTWITTLLKLGLPTNIP